MKKLFFLTIISVKYSNIPLFIGVFPDGNVTHDSLHHLSRFLDLLSCYLYFYILRNITKSFSPIILNMWRH